MIVDEEENEVLSIRRTRLMQQIKLLGCWGHSSAIPRNIQSPLVCIGAVGLTKMVERRMHALAAVDATGSIVLGCLGLDGMVFEA